MQTLPAVWVPYLGMGAPGREDRSVDLKGQARLIVTVTVFGTIVAIPGFSLLTPNLCIYMKLNS